MSTGVPRMMSKGLIDWNQVAGIYREGAGSIPETIWGAEASQP